MINFDTPYQDLPRHCFKCYSTVLTLMLRGGVKEADGLFSGLL